MCQFGAACTRPVCFFAHGEHQLRHTDMPGGPQPVVAPPEPVPALNGGFGGRDLSSPIDPAIKQQQQLMALQAAAAGFSHQQQQQQQAVAAAGSMPGGLDAMGGAGLQHVGSYPAMVDTNSGLGGGMNGMGSGMGAAGMGMGMGALQNPLGLASSSPLSAPLPQLPPDMLAALQSMGNGPAGGAMGNHLMHQHSGIPAAHYADPAGHNRLQRSFTAHPAVNAAAAAAAANDNSTNLNELSKQLAFMQLMQGGRGDTSGPLGDLNDPAMEQLLGLAQLQQHQAAAAAAAAAVTAGLDLGRLLPVASSGYGHTTDGSLSCPLPPVFGGGALGQGGPVSMHALTNAAVTAAASCTLPRVPTAPGGSFMPHSPPASDGGRDAPSPMGAGGRDTQVPAPSKKAARWSAPVSPSSSTRGGNDLAAADDVKSSGPQGTQQLSSSASSTSSAGGGENGLRSIPSYHLARGLSDSLHPHDISFSAGMGAAHGLGPAAGGASSGDAGSVLLMIGNSPLAAAQVHAALSGGLDASALGQQQAHGMGKEKAAQLLAQLPEDAVQKLLALVQQGGQ